jgi:peroxiredoxin
MKAAHFDLPGVDGARHSPQSARGEKRLVVMFICNHCPYVKRSIERIVRDCAELKARGVGSIAVMPNDPGYHAEDSFDDMKRVSRERAFRSCWCRP